MEPALIVAIGALVVSAGSAAFNMTTYLRNGGRVRVRLTQGVLDEIGSLEQGPFRTFRLWAKPGGRTQEVAVLRVENVSRTAVTLSDPSVDVGMEWTRGRWRPFRRTIGPHTVKFDDAITERRVRLEPFDDAMFLLDFAPVFQQLDRPRSLLLRRPRVLRGSVRVAGKRWRRRSPRRHGLRVKDAQLSVDGSRDVPLVVFRALVSRAWSEESRVPRDIVVRVVSRRARDGLALTRKELRQEVESHVAWPDDQDAYWYVDVVHEAMLRHKLINSRGELVDHRDGPGGRR